MQHEQNLSDDKTNDANTDRHLCRPLSIWAKMADQSKALIPVPMTSAIMKNMRPVTIQPSEGDLTDHQHFPARNIVHIIKAWRDRCRTLAGRQEILADTAVR